MTLVIAAQGPDYVILGTDSRGTIQDSSGMRVEINVVQKLNPVTKHVAILMYGAADEATSMIETFKLAIKKNVDGVSNVARLFADFCRDEIRKIKDVPVKQFPYFGFIIAGLDKKGTKFKIPRCYTLNSHKGFLLGLSKPFAINGKPFIAYYMFARKFRESLNFNELCELVGQAIFDTKAVDGDVGGKIRMAVIDSDGFREVLEHDVEELIEKW